VVFLGNWLEQFAVCGANTRSGGVEPERVCVCVELEWCVPVRKWRELLSVEKLEERGCGACGE